MRHISNKEVFEQVKAEIDSWPKWKQQAMATYGAAVLADIKGISFQEAWEQVTRPAHQPEEGK